ncbi:MAG: (2Fe-2S) ferredoxin domain-containing protein [Magnetococcus sp. DMHC-1]|nr:(2Fe-2S) ferredoxin domain-containing protein [Magnetococcales bacterium]
MTGSLPNSREVMLLVCTKERISSSNPSCGQRGSQALVTLLVDAIAQRHWPIPVKLISCFGECAKGPNVRIAPGGEMFHAVGPEDVPNILAAIEKFAGFS